MLDLSINSPNLEQDFDRIAQQLLQEYILKVGEQSYQLTEVEFYYNNEAGTVDNFAHKHPNFLANGTWRLHGAGLDIVLSQEGEYYGGILLRGLQPLGKDGQPSGTYLDGPWNSATHCIQQKGKITHKGGFYLEALQEPLEREWVKSPRVGLFLRKVEDLKYICKPWRYNSLPLLTRRYRQLIFLQAYVQGRDLQQALGLSTASKNNYIQYFEECKSMQATAFVEGGTGVSHTCRLFGYCYQHDLIP